MRKEEKEFLKKVAEYPKGLLSPSDLFNGIGQGKSEKIIQKLVAEKYLEEVTEHRHDSLIRGNYQIIFYRISEKGHAVFYPLYRQVWVVLRGDVRTIVVSAITALVTATITILVTSYYGK